MPSKTLSFNRAIFTQNVRSVGWVGLVHLLVLCFALPLQILMVYTSERRPYYETYWKNVFSVSHEFQVLIMFTIPVLLAIFIFRYLHVKLSADYIHSLPFRRETLFFNHLLFSILVLLLPIVITAIILLFLQSALELDFFLSAYGIACWIGTTFLIELLVFFASVFIGMVTGMSVLQGVLFYIMLVFPAGITVLVAMNIQYFLYGFSAEYYLNHNIERIVPLFRSFELAQRPLTWTEIVAYLVLIVVFFALSLWVYKKRDIETAGQAIAFRPLRPIFKYGVAFCFMLVGGLHFGETQNDFAWIVFGYVTASVLGYFIAEMILEKTWRVFHKWKGYLYFMIGMLVIGILLKIDIIGYEKRLPSLTEIERVYFDDGNVAAIIYNDGSEYVSPKPFFATKENMKNIYLLHQQIIKDKELVKEITLNSRSVVFGYELKDGSKIVRSYVIPFEKYKSFFKPIVESKEYKQIHYPLLKKQDVSSLDKITIQPHGEWAETTFITDKEQMAEFVSILKSELKHATVEQIFDGRNPWGHIELVWDGNERMEVTWNKSYTRLDEWLKQNGFLKARETADAFTHAVIIQNTEGKRYGEIDFEQAAQHQDALRINNSKQLEECLRQAGSNDEIPEYIIGFYSKGTTNVKIETMDEQYAPEFIRKHFAK
jgi:ABC-2 type transport system permease protein